VAAYALDEVFQSAEVISKINFTVTGDLDSPVVTEVKRDSKKVPLPKAALPNPAKPIPLRQDEMPVLHIYKEAMPAGQQPKPIDQGTKPIDAAAAAVDDAPKRIEPSPASWQTIMRSHRQ
jgi:hypothetical protein